MSVADFIPEATIRQSAEDMLSEADVRGPPVPVGRVARFVGARVVLEALDSDLSGVVHLVNGDPMIVANSTQAQTRQRFTIAHELGHLCLHGGQTFVDRRFVFRRNQTTATGTDREEMQANMFAAELLMPKDWLRRDVGTEGFDIGDDEALMDLARRYGVSQSAMLFRLANLRLADV